MKASFILAHPEARRRAVQAVQNAPHGFAVSVSEPNRSLDQNAAMWPILEAFSQQAQLCVNGRMESVSAAEWKDVLTAAFRQELQRVASFDGRMVLLGQRTSKFGKGEFSQWLEFLHAAAVEQGVVVYADEREPA